VKHAKRYISPREFHAWVCFNSHQPFGDEWRQTALLAMLTFNAHKGPDIHPRTVDDFLPVRPPRRKRKRRKWQAIKAILAEQAILLEAADTADRAEENR